MEMAKPGARVTATSPLDTLRGCGHNPTLLHKVWMDTARNSSNHKRQEHKTAKESQTQNGV